MTKPPPPACSRTSSAPLEDELGPLRTAHAANLAQALETTVLAEDQDDSAAVKATTKARLLALGGRLRAARQSDVAGSAARKLLKAALKANTQLILKMRQQLRPYKDPPIRHDVWLRFQGYTKSIVRNGGQPADSGNQYTPQRAIP